MNINKNNHTLKKQRSNPYSLPILVFGALFLIITAQNSLALEEENLTTALTVQRQNRALTRADSHSILPSSSSLKNTEAGFSKCDGSCTNQRLDSICSPTCQNESQDKQTDRNIQLKINQTNDDIYTSIANEIELYYQNQLSQKINDKLREKANRFANIYNAILAYSSSNQVSRFLNDLYRNTEKKISHGQNTGETKGRGTSIGKCLGYVKYAFTRVGFSLDENGNKVYPRGVNAKNFGQTLKEKGFINLLETQYKSKIKSPYDAPLGSILVYRGVNEKRLVQVTIDGVKKRVWKEDPGHTEVRTNSGFVSDYYSPTAITGDEDNGPNGRGRVLIGVYIKS